MRKLLFILGLVSTLFLTTACSNNDDVSESPKDLLIGEWRNDADPGYGDPTFNIDGRVEVHYFKEAWGDDFSDWGDWTLVDSNLKITWDDSDPGLEVYDTNIIQLTATKLRWEVMIDGQLSVESFTKK